MKSRTAITPGLHLVSTAAAPPPADPGIDHQIAEGVRALQALQQQFDNELFSGAPDPEVLVTLLRQMNLLRERLAAHGVKVRT
jgi:hypothetical protein